MIDAKELRKKIRPVVRKHIDSTKDIPTATTDAITDGIIAALEALNEGQH